ncbi:dihydrodipicolinate synthase family protein [Amycolatopsis sp. FDAARGOS 1241]|jgi:dihydrodipicolinate synthase/N-acetylneuraminate lyase|uniref:dihydrodipicolinate synthase family protein n=1 Tax=Amycolatopsis sp. FDAARGOS 1241 TaxID=2778070 RepID=UPI001952719E|nr:dihydrodipicolinate synthase family protein [Amycolatopsis sp. FDAARGOS 1241]QRP43049.1 dihydrodipicolinate synthase family protein [Amycolatopsis sp. FDAARGOS 1241]
MTRIAPPAALYVAAVTPYDTEGNFDPAQARRLWAYFREAKAAGHDLGMVVNPEAGELFYLSPQEQDAALELALAELGDVMPVIAGIISNSTADTVARAIAARDLGAHGLFLMPPIGALDITTSWDASRYPEVWADVIGEVVEAVPDLPVICHPVTAPTAGYGVGLPLDATMQILEQYPQVVGWKMTYNYEGYRKVGGAIRRTHPQVAVLGATAVNFHENLAMDLFDGTVTGSFNYALEPMLEHIAAWRAGDLEGARKIWLDGGLMALHEFVYAEWGRLHIRYKTATWLRGLIDSPLMRSPMPKPLKAEVQTLTGLLAGAGLSVRPQAEIDAVVNLLPR